MSESTTITRKGPTGKDYGYSNARIRGMRSRLLPKRFFEDLMESPDLKAMIKALSETEYEIDLEAALLHGHTFAAVDEALKTNMARTFRKVLSIVNEEGYHLATTLLGRWDLFNIKTIIRGKHMHLPPDEILGSLLAAGQLSDVDLRALVQQPDVRSVGDTLATWGFAYWIPLQSAVGEYGRTDDLSLLELALDKFYSEWAAKRLKGHRRNTETARQVLGAQIDAINLLSAFRLLHADVPEEDLGRFFLPGGLDVPEVLFGRLVRLTDVDEVLDTLKTTPYGRVLDKVVNLYLETSTISVFERALEESVLRKALARSRDALGVGVAVSYLWGKENEVTNLRIIVKGVSVGMPKDRMRRELIFV